MSEGLLARLGATLPVVAAPMAGGPTTPALVVAAGRSGAVGFLAGGYKTAADVAAQVDEVRAAGVPFGVNLFAPNPVPVDPAAYARYADDLAALAAPYAIDLTAVPIREDDDDWAAKVAVLLARPVPVVSFTFGIPEPALVAELRAAGTITVQTVTSVAEATAAAGAGVDGLVVQSVLAGGHWGTLTPEVPGEPIPTAELVGAIRAAVDLPIWGAGGVGSADDVAAIRAAGAEAVVVGTALLRCAEAGTSATYRTALADPTRTTTSVTRAFSGRPARGLRNALMDRYDDLAPAGYPAVHHLTTPLRRAAAAAGDPEAINLWAGTGFRSATEEPVADILRRLAGLTSG
ncbi:nitronate monooxygenase [Nocardioides marmoriginsengisoli]|uniref:Propionate 3-nitronate monooxygenase n=1 Tax=Nocardioides marmoriginsengisoli TaxID=661483 RepID=A0A3N0CD59_9ACTN|nr:nitronate monooxygenase [Nocardioides marmoriginsengisoli]RNL61368.1 nitronate monooxygenase [Nocardioides marmoriginsengisoli]